MHCRQKLAGLSIALCLLTAQANAVPILVGEWASPNSGDATEKVAVRTAIDNYNFINNPDLPQIFGLGDSPSLLPDWVEFVSKTDVIGPYVPNDEKEIEWTAPSDFDYYYILTKWGGGNQPKAKKKEAASITAVTSFDTALHYVSAGDLLKYNPNGAEAPNGLSHVWIWGSGATKVPDGGVTVILLGLALTGLVAFRRFVRR